MYDWEYLHDGWTNSSKKLLLTVLMRISTKLLSQIQYTIEICKKQFNFRLSVSVSYLFTNPTFVTAIVGAEFRSVLGFYLKPWQLADQFFSLQCFHQIHWLSQAAICNGFTSNYQLGACLCGLSSTSWPWIPSSIASDHSAKAVKNMLHVWAGCLPSQPLLHLSIFIANILAFTLIPECKLSWNWCWSTAYAVFCRRC